jgi:hypothetical protein
MRDTPTEYLARCHCGALTARYLTAVPIDAWSVRACQCSFCRAHAVLSTSDSAGSSVAGRETAAIHEGLGRRIG